MTSRISINRLPLAAVLVLISASALAAQVNVTGVLAGNDIGTDQAGILQASGSGTGTASHIGQFRYLIQATVNPAGSSEGVFLLVFSNGDLIYGSLAGQGDTPPPPPPALAHITEQLTITGGTGRFKGASGTVTFNRLVDTSTFPFYDSYSGTLTGTISTPGSSK